MHFKKILICHLGVVKKEFASERKKDSEPHTVLEKKCKKLFVFFTVAIMILLPSTIYFHLI